ncbi:MAG: winged helix DNA-binding domain-containing protein [Verrucomicrobia bacterium]|nr:winged helix DNA-binding domain-containing protein [Verrucomicrobiota bacterium]
MFTISALTARRFMLLATGLDGKFTNVDAALNHLGFVQIDPINVCGRMQDHILRHRVIGYREGDWLRHLHSPPSLRTAFEHHLPDSSNLAALPLDSWPFLQRSMQTRARSEGAWSGKLTPAEKKLAATLLARMATEGPLCSQDINSARKVKTHAWDSTTLAKSTLQKLFYHGRILIARRDANRRYYDLPEHLLPAPLDPVIYDRRVTESVWAFDYRWEVYVPPGKRVRGYYALPLLHRHRFIGHADLKADRSQGKLEMISQQTTSASHARSAVKSLAVFLGLKAPI